MIDALVWNAEEELTFSLAASLADSSVFGADRPKAWTGTIRRRATTLDRIAENHGIDGLAFLKCDAEGAEPEVLEGGRELLRRKARIAVDTGPERNGKRTSGVCEGLLRGRRLFRANARPRPDRDLRLARLRAPAGLSADPSERAGPPVPQHPLDDFFIPRRRSLHREAGGLGVERRPVRRAGERAA